MFPDIAQKHARLSLTALNDHGSHGQPRTRIHQRLDGRIVGIVGHPQHRHAGRGVCLPGQAVQQGRAKRQRDTRSQYNAVRQKADLAIMIVSQFGRGFVGQRGSHHQGAIGQHAAAGPALEDQGHGRYMVQPTIADPKTIEAQLLAVGHRGLRLKHLLAKGTGRRGRIEIGLGCFQRRPR